MQLLRGSSTCASPSAWARGARVNMSKAASTTAAVLRMKETAGARIATGSFRWCGYSTLQRKPGCPGAQMLQRTRRASTTVRQNSKIAFNSECASENSLERQMPSWSCFTEAHVRDKEGCIHYSIEGNSLCRGTTVLASVTIASAKIRCKGIDGRAKWGTLVNETRSPTDKLAR